MCVPKGCQKSGRSRRCTRMIVLAGIGLAVTVAAGGPVRAQPDDEWLSKRVVQKYANFQLQGQRQAANPGAFWIYRVEQVDGPRLRLRCEETGLSGWASADQVVPVEQAIDFFTAHIKANPADRYGYHLRASLRMRENREIDLALADLDQVIRLDPTDSAAFTSRGNARVRQKQYAQAIADFDQAIRLEPRDPRYYLNRGDARVGLKEYDKAIADYNNAIRIHPNFALAYTSRGNARVGKKEYDRANADYNKAFQMDPKSVRTLSHRAWFLATCPNPRYRDGKKAVESAEMACKLTQWKERGPIATLAAAYARAGDFAAAVKWQTKANELPSSAELSAAGKELLELFRAKKAYPPDEPAPDANQGRGRKDSRRPNVQGQP
jgi:tetratricopeptide (TPR) repeat protein